MAPSIPLSSSRLSVAPAPQRVLVVDDDPGAQRFFCRVLEQAGFDVTSAGDGREAAGALLSGSFCAVVSDIAMPHLTGVDLLRCVRVHDLDVPVLLVSGEVDVRTAAEAINHGAFQLLAKPVSGALLVGEVRRAARLHALSVARRQALRLLDVDQSEAMRLAELDDALTSAIGCLWMAYQPIVRGDGALYGYEALLRTTEPRLPNPLAVLDAASRLGRLDDVGRAVRKRAVEPLLAAPPEALLFVNLHARDLLDPSLLDPNSPLTRCASRIVLEITERSSLDEIPDLRHHVAELRAAGFRIAIDDLGAGYSGLSSFILLEPELVKIDMSLVRDVDTSATKKRLVRMIANTCKEMGIAVVAEGIETEAELDTVLELGCDLVQGYLIAKPARAFPTVASLVRRAS